MKINQFLIASAMLLCTALSHAGCFTSAGELGDTTALQAECFNVPVLIYHHVSRDYPPGETSISPARFAEHLDLIKRLGYSAITVSELSDYINAKISIPPKSIAITLDDGWRDNLVASLILKQREMSATFFIISGSLNNPEYLNKNDISYIEEMGFEIGSHTVTHFTDWEQKLINLPLDLVMDELVNSKKVLDAFLRKPVKALAWPYGYAGLDMINGAATIGYSATLTVNTKSKNTKLGTALEIQRLNIDGRCTINDLSLMLKSGQLHHCNGS